MPALLAQLLVVLVALDGGFDSRGCCAAGSRHPLASRNWGRPAWPNSC